MLACDSHLDQLSPSLLGREQGSALSRYLRLVCACAQCIADPAAPRSCGVTVLNHHGFNPGSRRCLQESGRILEAAGRAQGGWWGSAGCSSVVLPGGQFVLLRSSSSKVQTSPRIREAPCWAVPLQPACEDAGSGVSSPIHGLEVDVALSLDQKRSCNTIYAFFFFLCSHFLSSMFVLCHFLICINKIQCKCFKFL